MSITDVVKREIALINRMFQKNGIRARVTAKQTAVVEVGYISYGLQIAMDEKFAKVEGLQRELSNLISNARRSAVQVIPVSSPRLSLEVPHPSPKTLLWSPRKIQKTPAHSMLIGRSYLNGPHDERIAFDDSPHVLIAGITGAGKSVLLQTMILSLCAGASPDDLRLVLVDLKNEDLVPFECLPHIETFAGTREAAVEAIQRVVDEKDRRVAQRGYKPYRVVLVIDEMAQLATIKEAREMLGDLASIGRSKAINLIGATQQPTEAGGLGSLLKANFPVRLVGMVAPGQSHIATGRPQTHADLLPGKGAFLRCEGPNVYRFQSFFIDDGEVEGMAKFIAKDVWGRVRESSPARRGRVEAVPVVNGKIVAKRPASAPDMASYSGSYAPDMQPDIASYSQLSGSYHTSKEGAGGVASYEQLFPVNEGRTLTAKEAAAVRALADAGEFNYRGKFSMNRAMLHIYGSRNPERAAWISEALEGSDDSKIISLKRKAG